MLHSSRKSVEGYGLCRDSGVELVGGYWGLGLVVSKSPLADDLRDLTVVSGSRTGNLTKTSGLNT